MGAVHQGVSRLSALAGLTTLEVEICTCGVLFAAPQNLLDKRRQDGKAFYCPNGHSLVYDSENERLKRELERARDRAGRLVSERDQLEASLRGTKAAKTRIARERDRLKQRAIAGVCPHPDCHRHFENLERHVASKHPELLEQLRAGGDS